ncbi:AMP-binding protein [Xenorhabdus sp. XENO-10]|uniref:AMP-binding protein n=1 Tax=Xenorhabdus yunnanensis TaxID=3025878 RepID=A0ABT5LDD5_9GAMM|nr:AMP-binding protein [Xenorhabdus yunnanensis]MDC9589116.1 AMP-binding protein [Xenorhabdus yunnanensis]
MMLEHAQTLLCCLKHYVSQQPNDIVYRFLPSGDSDTVTLTWQELEQRSHQLACALVTAGQQEKAVILMYPPGLDFIIGLVACFKAGAIAVPSNVVRGSRHLQRLKQILNDSEAKVILTTSELNKTLSHEFPNQKIMYYSENQMIDEVNQLPSISPDQLAFLQYTSGSTDAPKGVMVTHNNLVHNLRAINNTFGLHERLVIGGWIPQFHDMGLVGHILLTVALGGQYNFMPPLSFIQKPLRWLQLMHDYGAEFCSAPNFAYDLCADQDCTGLNLELSRWRWAGNGAEPVRNETLMRFYQAVKEYGFAYQSQIPCYGLAEATLVVSSSTSEALPFSLTICSSSLEQGKLALQPDGVVIQASGQVAPDHRVVIVNPDEKTLCQPDEIGEIWVQGPSISVGYWNNPEQTQQNLMAYTTTGEGPFLRTGDLGCLYEHHLFITGRLKDLIIIRGRNIYPQDIEHIATMQSTAFRPGKAIAFELEQQVVVVIELQKNVEQENNFRELRRNVIRALNATFDINIADLVFIQVNKLPTTSSGKVQRRLCRSLYLQGKLHLANAPSTTETQGAYMTEQELKDWLIEYLTPYFQRYEIPISEHVSFDSLGLDSVSRVTLISQLEKVLQQKLDPILGYEYPTIHALSGHILQLEQRP